MLGNELKTGANRKFVYKNSKKNKSKKIIEGEFDITKMKKTGRVRGVISENMIKKAKKEGKRVRRPQLQNVPSKWLKDYAKNKNAVLLLEDGEREYEYELPNVEPIF